MMTIWKRRMIQAGATVVALTLSVIAASGDGSGYQDVEVNFARSAGIVSTVYAMESEALATATV